MIWQARGHVSSSRCRAEPTPSRSCICCARSTRQGSSSVAGLAHFNHQLRDEALRDEAFCVELAAACDVPIFVEREDILARAERDAQSIEHAASAARHEFFAPRAGALRRGSRRCGSHPRRPGRNLSAEAAARRRPERPGVHAPAKMATSSVRCSRAAARISSRTSTSAESHMSRTRRTRTSASRATASGPSCCRCSRSASTRTSSTSWPIKPNSLVTSGSGWNRS